MIFDKLKQLREIKQIQEKLKKETVEVEREGIKVVLNGNLEVVEIVLNPELEKTDQEEILKDLINRAIKKIQQKTMGEVFKIIS
ncbi:MAG: YbaB/EbfC family nucleoid-associated protein [Candidatus Pacebacteria bacterium]|nr:YbaB/EbfC family nucleoid-associated protein [Candidatus Paceibacterota bacterium]